jgi:hypothetical protein
VLPDPRQSVAGTISRSFPPVYQYEVVHAHLDQAVPREMITMKWLLTILGVVLTAFGVLWSLQGSGVLAHSAMSGQKLWLVIGVVVGVVGIVLLVSGVLRLASRGSVNN